MIIVLASVIPVGVIFVLVWWRQADQWADAERKRFKSKDKPQILQVVVRDEEAPR